jgi:hypothetical protein
MLHCNVKNCSVGFIHRLNYKVIKITTFRKLDSASVFRYKVGIGHKTYLFGPLFEVASDLIAMPGAQKIGQCPKEQFNTSCKLLFTYITCQCFGKKFSD